MLQKIIQIVEFSCVLPLLLLFYCSDQKEIIKADSQRWVNIFGKENQKNEILNLLYLLVNNKEFRNLYYFRLEKGNLMARLLMKIVKLVYQEWDFLLIDPSCNIGPGLFIQHGLGTIIMADLGENCWINQQVSIGYKDETGRPRIGDNVRITAGAKVLGNITIGNNVIVGANAVVLKNVPDNCVVVGVPAYIVKKDGLNVKEKL